MLNFDRCEPSILALTARIVRSLQRIAGLDPAIAMVIGAEGRNILHRGLGHTFALRSTTDLDIAIAVREWEIHDRLTRQLSPIGHTGIRYIVEEIPVDIIPFGDVEEPEGVVSPARRVGGLSVLGFQEVFARAKPLTLAPGVTIRIPHPAGYAALKMWAWSDRSIDGEDRDASDLAICRYWYQESDAIADRLYDTETDFRFWRRMSGMFHSQQHNCWGATLRNNWARDVSRISDKRGRNPTLTISLRAWGTTPFPHGREIAPVGKQ